nr:hypothetical protein Iba_chr11aCG8090 [Ipomoea batatas]
MGETCSPSWLSSVVPFCSEVTAAVSSWRLSSSVMHNGLELFCVSRSFPESVFETDVFVVKFESTAISEVGGSPLTEAGKDWKVISPIKVVQWISPGLDSGLDSQMHG